MDILLVLFLILLNGIFAMSEMALVSAKKIRLQQMADKGSIGALKAIQMQENPSVFFSSVQVGITTISILSGIVGEKSLVAPTESILLSFGLEKGTSATLASVLVIAFLTFLSVVFGEIIPKRIALVLSEKVAATLAIPMSWISKVAAPVVWLFTQTSQFILKIFKLNDIEQAPVSNEEIKELMEQGSEAGVFHESEKALVANVLHMDEKSAASIMTHRGEWKYIDLADDFQTNRTKLIENKISRVLVVNGDINNIVGFVSITDILALVCSGQEFDIKQYVENPLYLPQTVTASQVLEQLKALHKEIAIIINEYGENIGLVTLNDIMTSIVGDIELPDEGEEQDIVKREDGTYLVDGLISIDKLLSELGLEKFNQYSEINTLSGFIMAYAAKVPHTGYSVEIETNKYTLLLEVIDMDKNCVDKVLVKKTNKVLEETLNNQSQVND
jgi:putative hemolysin